jgi:spore coat protein CotH
MPAVPGDGTVGLRYKGASTLAACAMVADFAQRKCSFKVAFDEYHPSDKNYRHHGLKKLNLHSLLDDPTALSEKLGYRLFREMRIATARVSHAWVTVNGAPKGLFTVVESMTDGRFTEDKWPGDPNGNLYKQAWPGRLAQSTVKTYYDDKLETNTDAVPPVTHEQIIAFANDLKKSTIPTVNPSGLFETLKKWSDPEWMARFMAVQRAFPVQLLEPQLHLVSNQG